MTKATKQEISQRIGQSIAKHRKAVGMTQSELAERLDLSLDAMSRLERGNINLSVVRLLELAEIFGCESADLLDEASHRPRDIAYQIENLLQRLDDIDRIKLLSIIEQLVAMMESK
ncbi:helix-turn-helix domain-containing protein [Pelistega europaea]|uniref:Helix-turn-helix transcriptional regulator n=1 Tax=Pelistega europaea TaxID=106147 RepID=A0A7Y4LBG2_9BURK|nr:helix-turn-helix transcriptional regulator [Pelistega europaea]NOL49256.1 helix-turn-helix transcriptional regulator [Pelistega europaea]